MTKNDTPNEHIHDRLLSMASITNNGYEPKLSNDVHTNVLRE